ncbi:GFA family protein [Sphingomicrobium aestuariivivum]|uniref:GFA family protein n=1 Tax=Sphingomicrobium aestuariivivum TaxID=1582356 RepID=UPI001FD6FA9A|nr:GFA family protein [Sphingomicrobium aestuariivivum]MCJ8191079.1 GFA family protein [Sphingomicrobium aestuariivivum]
MSVHVEGACLCGSVKVSAELPDRSVEVCHCTRCRQWVGGPYISTQGVKGFTLEGEEHVRTYRSSDHAERGFCGSCGSALFFHFLPSGGRSFMAGLFPALDTSEDCAEEIFIDEKPGYYSLEGDRPRKTGAECLALLRKALDA